MVSTHPASGEEISGHPGQLPIVKGELVPSVNVTSCVAVKVSPFSKVNVADTVPSNTSEARIIKSVSKLFPHPVVEKASPDAGLVIVNSSSFSLYSAQRQFYSESTPHVRLSPHAAFHQRPFGCTNGPRCQEALPSACSPSLMFPFMHLSKNR